MGRFRNAYLRRDNDHVSVPARSKSRLVGCGNFETTEGFRTDSPAGGAQAHVSIYSCDFTNGYFQGQGIDRILMYFGLTCSRLRYNKCRTRIVASSEEHVQTVQVSLNPILPTLFTLRDDESRIIAVMSSNVDDLLYGYLPEGAEAMNAVLQQFLVGKEEHGTFNLDEICPLRSVTQSLAWIARQTRPGLSYRISKIQSTFENAYFRDLRECNRIVENATCTSTRGIYFSPECSWDDAVAAAISDVSFCQEQEQLDGITKNFKSQQFCITAKAPGNALNAEKMLIHPLSWSSTRVRRVWMAEAHALSNDVEQRLRTRATISDMRTPHYLSMERDGFSSNGTRLLYRL